MTESRLLQQADQLEEALCRKLMARPMTQAEEYNVVKSALGFRSASVRALLQMNNATTTTTRERIEILQHQEEERRRRGTVDGGGPARPAPACRSLDRIAGDIAVAVNRKELYGQTAVASTLRLLAIAVDNLTCQWQIMAVALLELPISHHMLQTGATLNELELLFKVVCYLYLVIVDRETLFDILNGVLRLRDQIKKKVAFEGECRLAKYYDGFTVALFLLEKGYIHDLLEQR